MLQMKEVPAAENNPYYQENKTETCSVNSLLYSGPQCSPRPILISLPPGPLGKDVFRYGRNTRFWPFPLNGQIKMRSFRGYNVMNHTI